MYTLLYTILYLAHSCTLYIVHSTININIHTLENGVLRNNVLLTKLYTVLYKVVNNIMYNIL